MIAAYPPQLSLPGDGSETRYPRAHLTADADLGAVRHNRVPAQHVSVLDTLEDQPGLAQVRARRSTAFAVGEAKARRREISADAYLFLYKELVGLAGDRTYCWPSLEYLTEMLETSEGTLKRWMRELERTDLIRRKPRPGGQTSLTYITAYLEPDLSTEPGALHDGGNYDIAEERCAADTTPPHGLMVPVDQAAPSSPQGIQPDQPSVFFASEQEISSDQPDGSELISQTVKSRIIKNPGGYSGGDDRQLGESNTLTVIENEVTRLLDDEDVGDPEAIAQLQNKPIEELQALSRYLDKQTNVRCRPGLFVWLARQDFGAKLLAGRKRSKAQRGQSQGKRVAMATDDPRTYRLPEDQHESVHPEVAELWHNVLDQLRLELSEGDYDTWIKPLTLVALEDGLAVVGTPNIFVREAVEQVYQTHLEAVLSKAYGRPMALQAVIGC